MKKQRTLTGELATAPREYETDKGRKLQQARCWMITVNMEEDPESAESKIRMRRFNAGAQVPPCSYAVFQPEQGEENERYHIQAYVEMEKAMSLAAIKKHFGNSVHAEIRAGTQQQAIDYCTKEGPGGRVEGGEVTTFGEPMQVGKSGKTQGSRVDWADAWNRLKKGERVMQVIEVHPHMLPCTRALSHARQYALEDKQREWKTKCTVLWGDSDCGKSSTAVKIAKAYGAYHRIAMQNNLWFDGYDPMVHQTIIFDEFTGAKMKFTTLTQLLDQFSMMVETKGGMLPFLAKHVIITSNFRPKDWYRFEDESKHLHWPALERRISNEVQFHLEQGKLNIVQHKGYIARDSISSKFPIKSVKGGIAVAAMLRSITVDPPAHVSIGSESSSSSEIDLRSTQEIPVQMIRAKLKRKAAMQNMEDLTDE